MGPDESDPRWHAFKAYNRQTLYGYGAPAEAAAYAAHLNPGREIDLYVPHGLDAAAAADLDLERRDDAFSLPDALQELDDVSPMPA